MLIYVPLVSGRIADMKSNSLSGCGFYLVLLAGLSVHSGCAHRPQQQLPARLEVGEPFALELPGLSGETVRISDYQGKVVLVDVWATWCAPCERSFPFYALLYRKWRERGFEVVAVSVDERIEDVTHWIEGRDLPFVVAHDPDGEIPEKIGLRTMPSAVVVDRNGRVAGIHAGFEDEDKDKIQQLINSVLSN